VVRKENDYLPKVLQQNNMLSLIIFAGKSLLSHLHNICQKIDFFTSKLFPYFHLIISFTLFYMKKRVNN